MQRKPLDSHESSKNLRFSGPAERLPKSVHTHRTARGHRNHCDIGRDAVAGTFEG